MTLLNVSSIPVELKMREHRVVVDAKRPLTPRLTVGQTGAYLPSLVVLLWLTTSQGADVHRCR
ncbi:protein of unknown function [Methylorubrum extorquens DM4]|uniref:Uncharacterized protein n=1 Tax=Methylorubrum extorquens (strain DSM 6343 / CIP 106787 / DM4) TaxID=661410 RepID=A0A2P9HBL2_METED|nr:protein of unknown function [Methylorubrum extorquens DM4]